MFDFNKEHLKKYVYNLTYTFLLKTGITVAIFLLSFVTINSFEFLFQLLMQ